MNPRAAINDLLPFQGSPFSRLGTSPSRKLRSHYVVKNSGEGGIRTHAPLRTNGFQDRLVMTTSIPLRAADLFPFVSDIDYINTSSLRCQQLFLFFLKKFSTSSKSSGVVTFKLL